MLVFCDIPSPRGLWIKYKEHLCEDLISSSVNIIDAENKCLHMISDVLESLGKNINDFALVSYYIGLTKQQRIHKEIQAEKNLLPNEADLLAITKLNQSQRAAFDTIIARVYSSSGGVFFVDGPGGTGKTFLYKCLLAKVRSNHDIALATATSGVAASLLPGGRTAHSRFKIPINGDDKFVCNIGKQSAEAALLRECKLILWDEATMANRRDIENVETTLRDITNCDKIFGGKVVVFGGDFRQTLPVIRSGSKRDFIEASLVKSRKICCDPYPLMKRGILTPKNEYVDEINNTLIARFPGEEKYYVSYDELLDSTSPHDFADFLHTISVPGLPPHKLILKKNCPVMLLRNINPAEGLCNGTRLICDDFRDHVIRCVIASGEHFGKHVFIPRIPLEASKDEKCSIPFKRHQFPIKVCFAMTINKAHGQTFDFVGIYLRQPVFSHGQLYVALSRAKKADCVKMLICNNHRDTSSTNVTDNIVYEEILTEACLPNNLSY
ncbi:PREDICTED: ATP-dependent DNA helicase RRM3-like [Ipomoea nil]|uniref:ATP-dependent DNA helicase RRM3-like n=1 Tax=Ipomoea nil TaxID=35883 RepID=UPI0009012D07|nr:PREDICTED: ATP-dependent DNA helicase RRM3-like [Ipomoea nil]